MEKSTGEQIPFPEISNSVMNFEIIHAQPEHAGTSVSIWEHKAIPALVGSFFFNSSTPLTWEFHRRFLWLLGSVPVHCDIPGWLLCVLGTAIYFSIQRWPGWAEQMAAASTQRTPKTFLLCTLGGMFYVQPILVAGSIAKWTLNLVWEWRGVHKVTLYVN